MTLYFHEKLDKNANIANIVGLPDQHCDDSSPDSASEDAKDSGGSDVESVINPGSGHHSDSGSDLESIRGSNPGSEAKSSNGDSSDSSASDDEDGGDFGDMFLPKKAPKSHPKRPESRPQSDSRNRSREMWQNLTGMNQQECIPVGCVLATHL